MNININTETGEKTIINEVIEDNNPIVIDYYTEVNKLVRLRYSSSQEFAILRQKDEKPEKYDEYYNYCEDCKRRVKEMMDNPL